LDRETGLVWERSPLTTTHTWDAARSQCTSRTIGSTTGERRKGWRLPSVHELASLVDPNQSSPALPPGHPFTNVQSSFYWSATSSSSTVDVPPGAWGVSFSFGGVGTAAKPNSTFVWCVRG